MLLLLLLTTWGNLVCFQWRVLVVLLLCFIASAPSPPYCEPIIVSPVSLYGCFIGGVKMGLHVWACGIVRIPPALATEVLPRDVVIILVCQRASICRGDPSLSAHMLLPEAKN